MKQGRPPPPRVLWTGKRMALRPFMETMPGPDVESRVDQSASMCMGPMATRESKLEECDGGYGSDLPVLSGRSWRLAKPKISSLIPPDQDTYYLFLALFLA